MKILTATRQGADREDDFCYAIEGEIVVFSQVCNSRSCGCDRALGGLNSHRATTTVMVRDVDLTLDDLALAAVGYLEAAGWAEMLTRRRGQHDETDPVRAIALELVQASAEIAARFDTGAVLRLTFNREDDMYSIEAA